MLQLKNICKDYVVTKELTVHALKELSVDFRSNEFVSILGPSGCGKTTLLNIIGGLDHYTHGDLIIDGVSTKDYKDRDWDTYRNHSIGFVFQTYNLIPHQTVLQNVELALTLAGVGKAERRERAEQALIKVGLGDQLKKRPNQLSGGQMQRVAIARALVNNPDIVLADEPTGALDTETGVQVMDILKEVAKDRLVIMVTHNPELAEQYSTRIIRILDGVIVGDTAPLTEAEYQAEFAAEAAMRISDGESKTEDTVEAKSTKAKKKKKKRSSMSLWTAFKLSLTNLFTKKGRTILTSFAGSIGIIGIALILSVSQGMTSYIQTVEEQTLTTYPLAIESRSMDLSSVVSTIMGIQDNDVDHPNDKVYNRSTIYNVAEAISSLSGSVNNNDLYRFKKFLEEEVADEQSQLHGAIAGLQYGYNLDLAVYTKNDEEKIIKSDVNALLNALIPELLGPNAEEQMGSNMYGSMATFSMDVWQELLPGKNGELINDLLFDQYEVVKGRWPSAYNEVVLVLNENNEISDISLYALGLLGEDYVQRIKDSFDANSDEYENVEQSWEYDEIMNRKYVVILDSSCYKLNEETGIWEDLREMNSGSISGLEMLYNQGIKLEVTGIIRPSPNATATMLNGAIAYTSALTKYVVEQAENSDALKAQRNNPTVDIFTGKPFKVDTSEWTEEQKADAYRNYFRALDPYTQAEQYIQAYATDISATVQDDANKFIDEMSASDVRSWVEDVIRAEAAKEDGMIPPDMLDMTLAYVANLSDQDIRTLAKQTKFGLLLQEEVEKESARVADILVALMLNPSDTEALQELAEMQNYMLNKSDAQLAVLYDTIKDDESDATYSSNLRKLGYVDLDTPTVIYIYASSFDAKDVIASEIERYNSMVAEEQQIHYTDFVALVMSAVTKIIDAITYVLIAFVAISLIVSSIMIGVITLISVQERTKEIGILRAIGASKRDVSSMFNAETVIIGLSAGLFGVAITYLLCLPINFILHALTKIAALNVYLPPLAALILVAISVGLTLISGFIPARIAAKKDPVTCLRTE